MPVVPAAMVLAWLPVPGWTGSFAPSCCRCTAAVLVLHLPFFPSLPGHQHWCPGLMRIAASECVAVFLTCPLPLRSLSVLGRAVLLCIIAHCHCAPQDAAAAAEGMGIWSSNLSPAAAATGNRTVLTAVANEPGVHNLVVCTLCSCYPLSVLGMPPHWYRSRCAATVPL
jgi:Nitrile hydratase, alpha chain